MKESRNRDDAMVSWGGRVIPREIRFWEKVDQSGGLFDCWEWIGCRARGYGQLQTGPGGGQHKEFAHRVSWEINVGPIPKGLNVLHRCDNPPCIRPDHLFLGTQIDNCNDMWSKGRGVFRHKLTPDQVVEIRGRAAGGEDFHALAEAYGVHWATIKDAVKRRRWAKVA